MNYAFDALMRTVEDAERDRDTHAEEVAELTAERDTAREALATATAELDALRAQLAPLVACVDALRAAARAAGWSDADATGETLVAWVRRGEREAGR